MSPQGEVGLDTFRQLEAHFHHARDLSDEQRSAYVAEQVPEAMRTELLDLLRADRDGETLARPRDSAVAARGGKAASGDGVDGGIDRGGPSAAEPGQVIGRYEVIEVLGEGGFGTVYRARQSEPVRRDVALKIVKWGMDSREVVARFDAERQALALMDHPSIAKVLDGGTTERGRPYFVMELVPGRSLTDDVRRRSLDLTARLLLFIQVCDAVQHAHQKGVVHRDLKPSNVLVAESDGQASVKVIDFGIAKAISGRLTDRTLDSARYRLLGTPASMSPEQARGELNVDTRSDIYALGVLLYELLCDEPPFDPQRLARAPLTEMVRILCEEEPPRPSRRLAMSRPGETALAARLRGDLDWITARALDKDPARRYASASELAADLERYLRREPVLVGPPSRLYRWRKFASRHRVPVALATLGLITLVAGILGTGAGLVEASRQRDAARLEAERAVAATDFLVETLALADPEIALDPDLSVRTLLDRAAARVDDALVGQPVAEARVRSALGRAYESLAEHAQAEGHLKRALELDRMWPALGGQQRYDALWTLTHVLYRLEKPDAQEIAYLARQEAHRLVRLRFPRLADVMDGAIASMRSGVHLPDPEPIEKAMRGMAAARTLAEEVLAADDPLWRLVADGCMDAGFSLWYTPHESSSAHFFRCAFEIRRGILPTGHPDVGESVGMLAGVLGRMGRAGEAESLVRQALDDLRKVFPADNFQAAFTEAMLGENLSRQGRFAEAEPLLLNSHRVIMELTDEAATFFPIDSHGRIIRLYEGWRKPELATPYRRRLAEIGTEATWPIPWSLVRDVLPAEESALVAVLDQLHGVCGTVAYSATVGDLESAAVEPALAELEDQLRSFAPGDRRAAVIGRLLVYWTNSLRPGEPARGLMARLALEILEGLEATIPLDVAEARAVAATTAPQGAERDELADQAWVLAGQQVADTSTDGAGADSWFTANAKARIGRAFGELGETERARLLLESAAATLEIQLGRGNRDYLATRAALQGLDGTD